jgi:hypothetical protein
MASEGHATGLRKAEVKAEDGGLTLGWIQTQEQVYVNLNDERRTPHAVWKQTRFT